MTEPRLRSPLGRAIGLGSAKEGVEHWWALRVTSIALVPLCLWFVAAVVGLAGTGRDALRAWIAQPVPAALMLLLIGVTFYHSALGLQVVVEDYVTHEGGKFALLIALRLLCVALAVLGVFSVLKLALGA